MKNFISFILNSLSLAFPTALFVQSEHIFDVCGCSIHLHCFCEMFDPNNASPTHFYPECVIL